jgi:hypothetical protein
MKQRILYLTGSILAFTWAGLLITGNTGLTIQPLNEAFSFAMAGMVGFMCLFGAVSKDKKDKK